MNQLIESLPQVIITRDERAMDPAQLFRINNIPKGGTLRLTEIRRIPGKEPIVIFDILATNHGNSASYEYLRPRRFVQ